MPNTACAMSYTECAGGGFLRGRMKDETIFTTWEAGRYARMSPYTVRHWVVTGKLPAYKTPGGHRRIRRQDLDAFLVAHAMPLPSDFREAKKRILLLLPGGSALAKTMGGWSDALQVLASKGPFDAGLSLATFAPHLFIVDFDAEGWDGLAACRRIRESPETEKTLLAGVSGSASVEMLEEAGAVGVLTCFSKPLDPKELRSFIQKLFPYCPLSSSKRV